MGKKLLSEAAAQAHYEAQTNKLSDKLPEKSFIIAVGETVPSPDNSITQADDLFESNKTFRGSILVVFFGSSSVHIHRWTEESSHQGNIQELLSLA